MSDRAEAKAFSSRFGKLTATLATCVAIICLVLAACGASTGGGGGSQPNSSPSGHSGGWG